MAKNASKTFVLHTRYTNELLILAVMAGLPSAILTNTAGSGWGGIPENPRQFLEMQIAVEDLGELEPLPENGEEETSQFSTTDYPLPREATT